MFFKPLDQITEADILGMVDNDRLEDAQLDFKLGRPDKWKNVDPDLDEAEKDDERWKAKREFLKDVTAFANNRGGDLIYGMAEKSGVAGKALGIDVPNMDQLILELQQLCENHTEPPLRVQARPVGEFDKGPVLVVRVPESWQRPHAVNIHEARFFWQRHENSNRPMTMNEIKQMVVGWHDVEERIRRFRRERVEKLARGEAPLPLYGERLVVFHIVPVEMFANDAQIDVRSSSDEPRVWQFPLNESGFDTGYTLDGRIAYNTQPGDKPGETAGARGYTLLFRNGSLETVTSTLGSYSESIHPFPIADRIRRGFRDGWTKGLQAYNLTGPYFVALSLVGWKGSQLPSDQFAIVQPWWPLREDNIMLPDVMVEIFTDEPADDLKQLWDYLWQTCGFKGFTDTQREKLVR